MNSWDTNPREIAVAIVIFLAMALVGIGIYFAIHESHMEGLRKYEVSYKANSESDFLYAKKTKVGDVLCAGDFKAVDPVTYERTDGEYMAIKVRIERYTQHTRTTTDSEGRTKVETYYEWDYAGSEHYSSEKFIFYDFEGNVSEIPDFYNYKETAYDGDSWFPWVGQFRYVIYTIPTEFYATGFWELGDEVRLKEGWIYKNIDESMEMHRSNANTGPIIFIVIWGILSVGVVAAFIYFDNDWLLDKFSRK